MTINDADGHKIADISKSTRFSVLKMAEGNRLHNLNNRVGALLSIGM